MPGNRRNSTTQPAQAGRAPSLFRHAPTRLGGSSGGAPPEACLSTGRRCCFLTATPRNKSAGDVDSRIKLFHQDDKTDLPADPPDLKQYFKLIKDRQRKLLNSPANILIRRTRNRILRWYGFDSVTHQPVDPSQFRDDLDGRKRA